MNRIYACLLLICAIVFNSCTSNSSGVKVGFLFPTFTINRFQIERDVFTAKVKEHGGEAIIADANLNDQLQIKQAEEMIDQGVKVLVVMAVNTTTAAQIARKAIDAGISVIAYDRLIQNAELDYYLSFDNVKVGKLMADYAMKIKPRGNYILIGGDKADKNAVFVRQGMIKALEPSIKSGAINVMFDTFIEDWSGVNAGYTTTKILKMTEQKPDVILSAYDGMSAGIIKSIEEAGLTNQIIVTGQDAELDALQRIIEGSQTMTIYKSVKTLATNAAELAFKIINHETIEKSDKTFFNGKAEINAILLEPQIVDASNIKSTVIADGFFTEKDIYNSK